MTEGGLFLPPHFLLKMKQDIFEEIKKAEKEAEEIAISAEKKKAELIEDAKATVQRILNMREKEISSSREKSIAEANEKIKLLKTKAIENSKLELKDLEKKALRRKEKAVEEILSRFDESLR